MPLVKCSARWTKLPASPAAWRIRTTMHMHINIKTLHNPQLGYITIYEQGLDIESWQNTKAQCSSKMLEPCYPLWQQFPKLDWCQSCCLGNTAPPASQKEGMTALFLTPLSPWACVWKSSAGVSWHVPEQWRKSEVPEYWGVLGPRLAKSYNSD